MWLWVVSALLLLLAWGGWLVLRLVEYPLSVWYPVLATLFVALLIGGVFLYRRLRAQQRARALERELLKQSELQAATARPDRRREVLELQQRFQQGISAVKQSKIGRKHGGRALYALPWYAIIGPPGAGKTTAIRHSGLGFPSLEGGAGGVKGVGGTRNCDWWFTNDAILLDTAGRWTTQEEDREEWLGFLGLLRRFRPEKPLNGLIVAISVSDLIQATDEQVGAYAENLRSRIDEIMTRLDMVLPVYVVFTKVDLIAGFVEFWSDLRKSERDQIFGATLPVAEGESGDVRAAFSREFQALSATMHARALRAIGRERHRESRQRIFQFPLEFGALRPDLEEFVSALFQKNNFQESPIFRGFYFTSGTQEGRPVDRVIGGMAAAFGIRPVQALAPQLEPKSYFVTDLFRRVIFPDQFLAARTASELRRQKLVKLGIAGGATLIGMLIAVPALISFFKNRDLSQSTSEVAKSSLAVRWNDESPVVDKFLRLAPAYKRLKELDGWEHEEGTPVGMGWGMWSGDELYPAMRDTYANVIDAGIAKPARTRLETKLGALAAIGQLRAVEFAKHYSELKLYLMMSDVERLDPAWAATHLTAEFQEARGLSDRAVAENALPFVRYYVEFIKRGEIPPWQAQQSLVKTVRAVLLRSPQGDAMYEVLVRDANAEVPPIRRETIFGSSPFFTSKEGLQVDGAYTKLGWEKIKDELDAEQSKLVGERWVLGDTQVKAGAEVAAQIKKLRETYFERYKRAWAVFLNDIEVREPDNAVAGLDELNALSEPEWPYLRLLRTLHENVTLDLREGDPGVERDLTDRLTERAKKEVDKRFGKDAGAALEQPKRPVSIVERAFQPLTTFAIPQDADGKPGDPAATGLAQYQRLLAKLVGLLTDLRDSKVPPDTRVMESEFQQAFRTTSELLATQDGFTRPLLSPLLMRPIIGAWRGVVHDSGAARGGVWEVMVWEKWRTDLEPLYPFSDSPKDTKLADFVEFFKRDDGLLWSFFDQHLKGALEQVGSDFVPTRRFQSTASFTGDFLGTCLKRGNKITTGVFPPKAAEPRIDFDVNLHSVSPQVAEVRLEIDGKVHVYKNTPEEWLKTQWPAKDAETRGARVRVRGENGLDEEIIRSGDFGFFRLLDAASDISPGKAGGRSDGAETVVATWKLRTPGAFFKLDVRPARADAALSSAVFKNYRCPRVIAVSGTPL